MAVTAAALVEIEEIKTCRQGHRLTPDNLAWDVSGRDGVRRPRCQTCKRESVRRSRAKNSPAPNASMIMPRRAPNGKAVTVADQTYETVRIWRLLPLAMRTRVAGVVMAENIDPVVRKTVERAANGRIWTASSPDMAARAFLENLLAATVDARSSRLGVDSLMSLLWGP